MGGYAWQQWVKVNIGGVGKLVADILERVVGNGHVLGVLDVITCTRQNALHIYLCVGTFLLATHKGCAHALGYVCGSVHARGAKVVSAHHQEYFGWLTHQDALEVLEHDGGFGTIHTTVDDVGIVEGFPPFVHVGDTVTKEYDSLVGNLVSLETVVAVIAPW